MTDVRTELSRLQAPGGGGYYRSRIPCAEDSEIARAINAFSESTPREQAAFRAGVDRTRAGLLQVWSERIAALAVRLDSPKPLVIGLVGLSRALAGRAARLRGPARGRGLRRGRRRRGLPLRARRRRPRPPLALPLLLRLLHRARRVRARRDRGAAGARHGRDLDRDLAGGQPLEVDRRLDLPGLR